MSPSRCAPTTWLRGRRPDGSLQDQRCAHHRSGRPARRDLTNPRPGFGTEMEPPIHEVMPRRGWPPAGPSHARRGAGHLGRNNGIEKLPDRGDGIPGWGPHHGERQSKKRIQFTERLQGHPGRLLGDGALGTGTRHHGSRAAGSGEREVDCPRPSQNRAHGHSRDVIEKPMVGGKDQSQSFREVVEASGARGDLAASCSSWRLVPMRSKAGKSARLDLHDPRGGRRRGAADLGVLRRWRAEACAAGVR